MPCVNAESKRAGPVEGSSGVPLASAPEVIVNSDAITSRTLRAARRRGRDLGVSTCGMNVPFHELKAT
ncbi:hypothetical protein GCM10009560_65780 [Nonomuraea longicatena]|uniref:Uncharacterized protein n=1 Tax=Nonomuraea longicatena TaxID=83682 RepID=A0ABN1QWW2_9ACTN